ncbi:MAG: hypothetical protein JJE27_00505 [Thermoleophilia bacterium]|nr:hypothetical protein [Thermoleophilia bacterium]
MTTSTIEINFSDLLRKSGEVLREVEDHDVLLRRRDGADLILVRADREAGVRGAAGVSTTFLSWFARTHVDELISGLPEVFPWTDFLLEGDRRKFADEFVRTLAACESLGSFDHLSVLIDQWRNTAYVWSRPELLETLRSDAASEDFDEPVASPAVAAR